MINRAIIGLSVFSAECSNNQSYDYAFMSSTEGLFKILRQLSSSGSSVVLFVPDFICNTVIDAVKGSGVDYMYYSINEILEVSDYDIFFETDYSALLVVNYFGINFFDKSILRRIHDNGKTIIVDNAHSYGMYVKTLSDSSNYDITFASLHKTFSLLCFSLYSVAGGGGNNKGISFVQKQNELHGVLCVIKSFIRGLFSKYLFRRNFKYNYSVINKNVSHLLFKEIRCSLRVPLVISFFLRHFDLNRLEVIYVKNYARLRSVFLLNNNYYVPAVDCHDFPTSMPVVCPSINRADSFLEYMYNMNIDAYKWPDLSSDNRSMFVVDLQRRIVVLPLAKDISNIVKAYLDIN